MRAVPGGLFLMALGGVAYYVSSNTAATLTKLYDTHRLFTIYAAHVENDGEVPAATTELIEALEIDKQKEPEVLNELAKLMRNGDICVGPTAKDYAAVFQMIKKNLDL